VALCRRAADRAVFVGHRGARFSPCGGELVAGVSLVRLWVAISNRHSVRRPRSSLAKEPGLHRGCDGCGPNTRLDHLFPFAVEVTAVLGG